MATVAGVLAALFLVSGFGSQAALAAGSKSTPSAKPRCAAHGYKLSGNQRAGFICVAKHRRPMSPLCARGYSAAYVSKKSARVTCRPVRPAAAGSTPRAASLGAALPAPSTVATSPSPTATTTPAEHEGFGVIVPERRIEPEIPIRAGSLPESVNLTSYAVPVGNQGRLGSCVTWAIDYGMLGWYSRHDGRAGQPFNPMFTYSQIHSNTLDANGNPYGSTPEAAFEVAEREGNDTMAHYLGGSGETENWSHIPTASERANAANYRIVGSKTFVSNNSGVGALGVAAIKERLAQGKPVSIGMYTREVFNSYYVNSSHYVYGYSPSSRIKGSHEMLALGYSPSGLWVENSWGEGFGLKGYVYLSWEVVEHDVMDANTIAGFASAATDTTSPTMGNVSQHIQQNGQITGTGTPVVLEWSASDDRGVTGYEVYVSYDNGSSWTKDERDPAGATSITRLLSFGGSYKYAVRAHDAAGNVSSWAYGRALAPTAVDDQSFGALPSNWTRYPLTEAFGGTYMAAQNAGAYVQKEVSGTDVAWVATKFAAAGRATVYCDGSNIGVADLYSATTVARSIVATCHFPTAGAHTIKIVNEATAGRSWMDLDAFVAVS